MTSINHAEAQEMHEAIGAAIETGDVSGLARAREIAAMMVSDTEPDTESEIEPFDTQLIIDADHGEDGWEIVLRFGPDDCEGAWSELVDDALPALIGPAAAAAVISARDAVR